MSSETEAASGFRLFQSRPHAYKVAAGAPATTHISGIKKGGKGRAKGLS